MKLWIARDKDTNELWIYNHRPVRRNDIFVENRSIEHADSFCFTKGWFPEITFENSPKEVELKIIE